MRSDKFLSETRVAAVAVSACVLAGCVIVRPANSSKSLFAGNQSAGETVNVNPGSPGNETFRVYHQGASPYESMPHVVHETHLRAKEYCDRKGEVPESITETTSVPPYTLDNLPRMEEVVPRSSTVAVLPATAARCPSGSNGTSGTEPQMRHLRHLRQQPQRLQQQRVSRQSL